MHAVEQGAGEMTHYYVHRYEQHGKQAPLPKGKYTMICDVYECGRKPRCGESSNAYRDYVLQSARLVKSTKETHVVE